MAISYRTEWTNQVNERLEKKKDRWGLTDGYPGIMESVRKNGGRFATWDKLYTPGSGAEHDLDYYIKIASVLPTHPYAQQFLAWANEAADRALVDPRFQVEPDTFGKISWKKPGYYGQTLAAACLSRALQANSEIDNASLVHSCDDIAGGALDGGSKSWDYIAQGMYLRCVRLCLVAGNPDKAQFFLKNIRRKFKHSFIHQEWLQTLTDAITAANGAPLAPEAAAHFQAFFNQVRNPAYQLPSNQPGGIDLSANLSILRLELAIIKQRYLLVQPLAGHWQQVLGLISE
jgi:hypothetical protein